MSDISLNITWLDLILVVLGPPLFGYVLGSIPFGLMLTRAAGIDIRAVGSGNIGATNVLRTGRRGLALATLLLDSGKAAAATLLVAALLEWEFGLVAGVAAVIGHNYPIWLRFRGGKGVAATLGVLLAGKLLVGLLACGLWLATALVFRISSLAALVSLTVAPFAALALQDGFAARCFAILAALAWWKHRENLGRLLAGAEPRIGRRNNPPP